MAHTCMTCFGYQEMSPPVTMKQTGPWFNKKMSSYQYRKSHCGDKTILRPSYLHNGISYTGKTTSLYWIGAQVANFATVLYTQSGAVITQSNIENNIHTRVANCLCTHERVILVFISQVAQQWGKWTPKITFEWAHKQFVTRVHIA